MQMTERKFGGPRVVEQHVCHAFNMSVPCHGNNGNRDWMLEPRIDGDDSLRSAAHQHTGVVLDQVSLVTMVRREVEIARLNELVAYAAHHLCVVTVAKFRHEDTDCKGQT